MLIKFSFRNDDITLHYFALSCYIFLVNCLINYNFRCISGSEIVPLKYRSNENVLPTGGAKACYRHIVHMLATYVYDLNLL